MEASFRDDAFDMKKWLNASLPSSKGDTDLMSSTAMKLQVHCQELSKRIEERMAEAMTVAPSVVRETRRIKSAASALQEALDSLHAGIVQSNQDHRPVEALRDLHIVKKNLAACSETLVEAANWDNLNAATDACFQSQDLSGLSKNLELMRKSQRLLEHMPNAQSRADALARVEQRMENLVFPSMMDLLQREADTKALTTHVQIFRKLGREDQLRAIYTESKQEVLHSFWRSFGDDGCEAFRAWLPQFYSRLNLFMARERSVVGLLFSDPFHALCDVLCSILGPLSGSFSERMGTEPTLDTVREVFAVTAEYSSSVLQALLKLESNDEASRPACVKRVVRALVKPYAASWASYARLEKASLGSELERILGEQNDATPSASFASVAHAARKSYARCTQFTGGLELPAFISGLEDMLVAYFDAVEQEGASVTLSGGSDSTKGHAENVQGALKSLQALSDVQSSLDSYLAELADSLQDDCARILESDLDESSFSQWILSSVATKAQLSSLSSLSRLTSDKRSMIMPKVGEKVERLVISSQQDVHASIFSAISSKMDAVPTMGVWNRPSDDGGGFGGPSKYISDVGEQLLMLVQHLEPFASSERRETLVADAGRLNLGLRKNISAMMQTNPVMVVLDSGDEDDGVDEFSESWLFAVGEATALYMVLKVLNIPTLSVSGTEQLSADFAYIVNVLSAMGMYPGDTLQNFQFALGLRSEEDMKAAAADPGASADRKRIVKRIWGKRK